MLLLLQIEDTNSRKGGGGTFLVPMNGGIWTMCVALDGILLYTFLQYLQSLRAAVDSN